MKLPASHELISLFGQEPRLTDAGLPWTYNELTFTVERSDDRLEVTIAPSYGTVRIHWQRGEARLVDLDLSRVCEVISEEDAAGERMVVNLDVPLVRPLTVHLKPGISVEWGVDEA